MTNKKECADSYSVSGYTRADGVEVSGYTRTCGAAHNSSSSDEKTLSNEEKMKHRADILYPTMENNTNNKTPGNQKPNDDNQRFKYSMKIVFKHEGGFSDDPDDLGGRTNLGITQVTYNDYCKRHSIKTKDVKELTKEEAINIYYNDYWQACGADKISNPVGALILFDTAVLHGVGTAKKFYKESKGDFKEIIQIRKNYYEKRVKELPSQKKYLKGWNNRADNLLNILKKYEEKDK